MAVTIIVPEKVVRPISRLRADPRNTWAVVYNLLMPNPAALTDHTIAIYETHDEAEAAIKALTASGHEINHLSIVGQDYAVEERPIGFINTGERMLSWGKMGAFWGSIWGLFLGSAMIFIPGLGYVMFAGWLVSALEGAIIGGSVGALAGALASLGIPKDSVVKYEWALKEGRYLVIVHGDEKEVADAMALLADTPTSSLANFTSRT